MRIPAIVIMGVSGCGKSSVGEAIAATSGVRLIEGDAFHPAENIAKMSVGIPLTDADRVGWLRRLGENVAANVAAGDEAVLTCSALKLIYRNQLRTAVPGLGFVFLELSPAVAAERMAHRPSHFMPASLVDSQFATLEPPTGEPRVLTLDATLPLAEIAARSKAWWRGVAAPRNT